MIYQTYSLIGVGLLHALASLAATPLQGADLDWGNPLWSPAGPCAKASKQCQALRLLEFREGKRYSSDPKAPADRRLAFKPAKSGEVITKDIQAALAKAGHKLAGPGAVHEFTLTNSGTGGAIDAVAKVAILIQKAGRVGPPPAMYLATKLGCDPRCEECCAPPKSPPRQIPGDGLQGTLWLQSLSPASGFWQ